MGRATSSNANPAITQANLVRIEHLLQRKHSENKNADRTPLTGTRPMRLDPRRRNAEKVQHRQRMGQGFDIVLHGFPTANPLSTWYLRLFIEIISPRATFRSSEIRVPAAITEDIVGHA